MKTATLALTTLLDGNTFLVMADLYTLTLSNGTVIRWSGLDKAITFGANTWSLGPILERSQTRTVIGVEVDTLTMSIADNQQVPVTISGVALIAFAAGGGLDGATIRIDRAFMPSTSSAVTGTLVLFSGRVSQVVIDRFKAELSINSDLELLNIALPRNVYQPGCLNTLYDASCGVVRASYVVTGATTSGTDSTLTTVSHTLAQATGYFDLGVITMTSGANSGSSRTVRAYTASGTIIVLNPWAFPVAIGATFSMVPGCDKTRTMCNSKFSDLARYRGFPFIPVTETVT